MCLIYRTYRWATLDASWSLRTRIRASFASSSSARSLSSMTCSVLAWRFLSVSCATSKVWHVLRSPRYRLHTSCVSVESLTQDGDVVVWNLTKCQLLVSLSLSSFEHLLTADSTTMEKYPNFCCFRKMLPQFLCHWGQQVSAFCCLQSCSMPPCWSFFDYCSAPSAA